MKLFTKKQFIVASIGCALLSSSALFAQEGLDEEKEMENYFENLDASVGMPKGMTEEYIIDAAKKAGKNEEELKLMLEAASADACSLKEMSDLCDFMGKETIYKARNKAAEIRLRGGGDETVFNAISPIIQYGISQRIKKRYGDSGLVDTGKVSKKKVTASLYSTYNAFCGSWNAAVDAQNISGSYPFVGHNYRLVTCAKGVNWYINWVFNWSIQSGAVITHSRFERKINSSWYLTAAPHIYAKAYAMGVSSSGYTYNTWHSPLKIANNSLWNQPAQPVYATGHAHKLGHSFNTTINF